ncbi:DgyrCDS8981 [Dimorphilus gyrociliatus]|uniref:40S ribosomal protein S8 n=1 Tax=Dimorphilus gyrociliatus TaxID=2664684 RepID=A0A7I8VY28_9ANNE|nr:DgyrCDS8981 [Dimorphilus gyrociliatus]
MCPLRKKRKFELGRPPANTKLYAKRVRTIRVRGGNTKVRALRLDHGNYSWGSEACTHKTRILDVVYNASNNELVRTKTLVKNAIVQIDATPFRHWYEQHYCLPLGRRANTKKGSNKEDDKKDEVPDLNKKSKKTQKKYLERQKHKEVEKALEDQFLTGRILG